MRRCVGLCNVRKCVCVYVVGKGGNPRGGVLSVACVWLGHLHLIKSGLVVSDTHREQSRTDWVADGSRCGRSGHQLSELHQSM